MKKKKKRLIIPGLRKLEEKFAGKPGITIGRPVGSKPEHVNNWQVHRLFQRLLQEGYAVDEYDLWHPTGCSIVAEARNMIVDTFLKRDGKKAPLHEYILWIDDDQCFPLEYDPYDALKLLLEDDKDIVGAMTVRKFPPHRLNISIFKEGGMRHIGKYPKDEPFCVHQLGFGLVLVKRKVIEALYNMTAPPAPIFQNPLQWNPMLKKVELRGEDYLFCINAMKMGFDIWVEPRIPLQHIGQYPFGVDNFEAYLPMLEKDGGLLDLCQDTSLYAELADALKKSGRRLQKDPEKLSNVAAERRRAVTIAESKSTQKSGIESGTPMLISTEKNEKSSIKGGNE